MLVRSRNVDVLDQLNDRVRRVRAVSADLMLDLIEATSALLPELNGTRKAAVVHRLVKCRAWTDAALALLEIELPQWKLRRLVFEDGKWLCSLSKQVYLPLGLDDSVDARHEVLPLAILSALLEARRDTITQESPPTVPHPRSAPDHAASRENLFCVIPCDNFR